MKLLILGGYGVFGGRLAELLADLAAVEIVVAGRSFARAAAFCAAYRGAAKVRPLALDRRDVAGALRDEAPALVVDASGPFQDYGERPYGVIESCIAAKIDYLDFADAADFVFGVAQFDAAAKAAGVFALSGVSSFPVLTAAVLREMAKSMEIVAVEGGIAPSPFAGVGLNVMRAVISYAGAPVKLRRGGRPAHGLGLAESLRFTVAPPGRLPLRNIHFSLVDVPDLQVLPPDYPAMTDIWMGAGPVPEILHRLLNLLAKARARFGLPSLEPLSPMFYFVLNLMRFGEHRGGMFVRARGRAGGAPTQRSWHLLAEGDDGPYIPSMAIEAIVRKLLAGERPAPGARSAAGALDLGDYDALFEGRQLYAGFRDEPPPGAPLYRWLLGGAFDRLPPSVRRLHESRETRRWTGFARVRRGGGPLGALVAAILGLPPAAARTPVTVDLVPERGGERWIRSFGGATFSSRLAAGEGKEDCLLVERIGAFSVALALVADGAKLRHVPRRWRFLNLPLPRFLMPGGETYETEEDGHYVFHVEITLPLIGFVVGYEGDLTPSPPSTTP